MQSQPCAAASDGGRGRGKQQTGLVVRRRDPSGACVGDETLRWRTRAVSRPGPTRSAGRRPGANDSTRRRDCLLVARTAQSIQNNSREDPSAGFESKLLHGNRRLGALRAPGEASSWRPRAFLARPSGREKASPRQAAFLLVQPLRDRVDTSGADLDVFSRHSGSTAGPQIVFLRRLLVGAGSRRLPSISTCPTTAATTSCS